MDTQVIRKLIKEAVTIENQYEYLREAIIEFAGLRGMSRNEAAINDCQRFIIQYIEHIPDLLDHINSVAIEKGVSNEVLPILNSAEKYFLNPIDIIPDRWGLLGRMDDAYLTHCLIQSLSDRYKARTGNSLVPVDLKEANKMVRALIGEPQAGMLDEAIQEALGESSVNQSLEDLLSLVPGIDVSGPDPIWGDASPDEIAKTQLGTWGVT